VSLSVGPALVASGIVADRELTARFREGDANAVRAVYRQYGRLVFGVSLRILNDRALAEESTQQTFLKAWRAADAVDPERDLGPWLATIARRVAIDSYRREALRAADSIESVPPSDPALASATESAESVHDAWAVREAVEALPEDEQQVVRLQHFGGMTHAEIAEKLKLAVGTVKSRSFRAHRRLAEQLAYLRE
jgi:RNA polymerase sigma factor (sigma-70 family)